MTNAIGYHYTSYECWQKIKREGLKPYTIYHPEVREYIHKGMITGIWLWWMPQTGLSHRGCILYQMSQKNSTKIVLLSVKYNVDDRMGSNSSEDYILPHNGYIGELHYHSGKDPEKAYVIKKTIPAKKITLLAEYDLLNVWDEPKKGI